MGLVVAGVLTAVGGLMTLIALGFFLRALITASLGEAFELIPFLQGLGATFLSWSALTEILAVSYMTISLGMLVVGALFLTVFRFFHSNLEAATTNYNTAITHYETQLRQQLTSLNTAHDSLTS